MRLRRCPRAGRGRASDSLGLLSSPRSLTTRGTKQPLLGYRSPLGRAGSACSSRLLSGSKGGCDLGWAEVAVSRCPEVAVALLGDGHAADREELLMTLAREERHWPQVREIFHGAETSRAFLRFLTLPTLQLPRGLWPLRLVLRSPRV